MLEKVKEHRNIAQHNNTLTQPKVTNTMRTTEPISDPYRRQYGQYVSGNMTNPPTCIT